MQSMPASIRPGSTAWPKQWAVTLAPCSWATAIASANASARERRRQVALLAGDPVADQLDPAVAALRLAGDVRAQLAGLDLVGVVADVALGAGDVPAGADQPRQVLAVVDPGGVGGRAAVADQQRAGVAVLRPPAARSPRRRSAPSSSRPRWQWASTRPGTIQPSHGALGAGDRLVGDPAVDDVQLAGSPSGSTGPENLQRSSHAPDAIGCRAATAWHGHGGAWLSGLAPRAQAEPVRVQRVVVGVADVDRLLVDASAARSPAACR